MAKTHISQRIWAILLLLVMVFGMVTPGTVTTAYAADVPCMIFSYNGTQYTIYPGQSGSGTGVSWSCTANSDFHIRFTASGTFRIIQGIVTNANAVVIGGGAGGDSGYGNTPYGGSGGYGGGGGEKVSSSVSLTVGRDYQVVIGEGGTRGTPSPFTTVASVFFTQVDQGKGGAGGSSSFNGITAKGGTPGAGGAPALIDGSGSNGSSRGGGGGGCCSTFYETAWANFSNTRLSCWICGEGDAYVSAGPGGSGNSGGGAGGTPANDHGCTTTSGRNGQNGTANTGGGGGGGAYSARTYRIGDNPLYYSPTHSAYPMGTGGCGGLGGSGVVEITGHSEGASGDLIINKSSDTPSITEGSTCYDLSGATYGVYTSQANAQSGSGAVATLTTNSSGVTTSVKLGIGTYYIKETKAPTGYALDTAIYQITIYEDQTSTLNVSDTPLMDPVSVVVKKTDATTGNNTPSGGMSLAGAEFVVSFYDGYYDTAEAAEASGAPERSWTIRTDADGTAELNDEHLVSGDAFYYDDDGYVSLPLGTVVIYETKAPDGYLINTTKYATKITQSGSGATSNTVYNAPTVAETAVKGGISVMKRDAELPDDMDQNAQGSATLAGAVFAIINNNAGNVTVGGKTYAPGAQITTITTDATGYAETDADLLPYGSYLVKEITAPSGYTLNETWQSEVTVSQNGVIVSAGACENVPVKGGVEITKIDKDTGTNQGLGGISLGGAVISIYSDNDTPIAYDGKVISKGELVCTMETDANGHASTGQYALPVGSYTLRETTAPSGYEINDEWVGSVTITAQDNGVIKAGDTGNTLVDELMRSDVHFQKAHGKTLERLAGVVFKVTSKATGESHIIVTDTSGSFNSAIAPHSQNTNVNDAALNADGTIDESKLVIPTSQDTWYGVWFYGSPNPGANERPVDDVGAFPYGTYIFEELRTSANEGLTLLKFEYDLILKNSNVDMGTLLDYPTATIGTTLTDAGSGLHVAGADNDLILKDNVQFSALDPGVTYTMVGTLMDKETGEPILVNGQKVEARQEFTPTTENGTVEMTFRFDASALGGKAVVAFEQCLDADGNVIAKHEDIDDEGQTVYIPTLGTTAAGSEGEKELLATTGMVVVDTIAYENLLPDVTYTLRSSLVDKATGEVARADNGDKLEIESKFKPTTASGTVDVTFKFDGTKLAGKTLVVYESIEYRGSVIAAHQDLNDAGQTVTIPKIGTTLTTESGSHHTPAGGEITLVDTIAYENLVPGQEYTATGTLMSKATGEALKDAEGKDITATTTFTPESANGTVEVKFTFDSTGINGGVVAFEEVSNDLGVVAEHKDIDDEDQTVDFPGIETTATDKDGNKVVNADTKATIVDVVEYTGLVAGTRYTLYGRLMDKDTGKVLTDSNGKEISVTKSFTPREPDGSVELTFTVAAADLPESAMVAFETLYLGDIGVDAEIVAEHEDIEDEGQTVYVMSLCTTATDSQGNKEVPAKANIQVKDVIAYENLLVGETYTVSGTLMDKSTGKAAVDSNGNTITASKEVTIEGTGLVASGEIEVTFTFDASQMGGKTLVAFEEIYDAYGKLIGSHKDLTDADQTVYIPQIETTLVDSATGGHEAKPGEKVTLIDTVEYTNLVVGKSYTMTGKLMDKETGEAVTDAEGNEITATTTFTAETADGSVELSFTFDASLMAGKSVVAFESLHRGDREFATHADLTDEDQTVHFPEIGTTATVGDGNKLMDTTAGKDMTISDSVQYKNLIPGNRYTLVGKLMDKATGEVLTDAEGNEITQTVSFTAETANGSVLVKFEVPAAVIEGKTTVAFETLYKGEKDAVIDANIIAEHEDIEDEDQTVYPFDMGTTATSADGDKELP